MSQVFLGTENFGDGAADRRTGRRRRDTRWPSAWRLPLLYGPYALIVKARFTDHPLSALLPLPRPPITRLFQPFFPQCLPPVFARHNISDTVLLDEIAGIRIGTQRILRVIDRRAIDSRAPVVLVVRPDAVENVTVAF
jgi:hypothetical protein